MGTNSNKRPADHPSVAAEFYFEGSPIEELVEVARRWGDQKNTAAKDLDRNLLPECLKQHFRECLDALGYPFDESKWRYWVGRVKPYTKSNKEGWAKGFPHTHQWDALTLVHYVQVPESGGATIIMHDDKVTKRHEFWPQLKATIVMDGWSEHGVGEVFGEIDRLTILATGFK